MADIPGLDPTVPPDDTVVAPDTSIPDTGAPAPAES